MKNLDPKADFCSFNNYVMLNLLFWLPKYSPKRLLSKKKSSFFLSITSDNHAHNFSSSDACLVTPIPSKLIFTPLISILFKDTSWSFMVSSLRLSRDTIIYLTLLMERQVVYFHKGVHSTKLSRCSLDTIEVPRD